MLIDFNEIIILGEVEFETTGTYELEESDNGFYGQDDIYDEVPATIEFNTITITVDNETVDGFPIVEALNCWEVLEREIHNKIDVPDMPKEYED